MASFVGRRILVSMEEFFKIIPRTKIIIETKIVSQQDVTWLFGEQNFVLIFTESSNENQRKRAGERHRNTFGLPIQFFNWGDPLQTNDILIIDTGNMTYRKWVIQELCSP